MGFVYPYVCHVSGRGAFSRDGSEKFGPRKFVGVIPKNSRVAYDINTIHGLDLRGAEEGLFGAGARSTIMTNANFAVKLFNAKLVQFDNYTGDYHFCRPWQARELQRLGISYVAQEGEDDVLVARGWKRIAQDGGFYLYQNPLPSGVVYLKDGDEIRPLPFIVQGNGLDIELPEIDKGPQQFIISFLRIPGWRAWVDGRPRDFLDDGGGDEDFLTLPISSKDRLVRVRYGPVPFWLILASSFAAMAIPWFVLKTGFPA